MLGIYGFMTYMYFEVYGQEGKKWSTFFRPPKLGEPPHTRKLYLLCTTHIYNSSRRHYKHAAVAYRLLIATKIWSHYNSTMEGLLSSRGRDGSLTSPVFVFLQKGGGRFCTVHCVRLYKRGTALYCPLCSVLGNRGWTALYRPLCSASYSRGGVVYSPGGNSSLPSAVFGFIYNLL